MNRVWKYILAALVVLIIAFIIILKINAGKGKSLYHPPTAVSVRVEKPVRQLMTDELDYSGNVEPIQQANIFSKVTGNLEDVYVNIGTGVEQNQLLAAIDSSELYQNAVSTKATYQNASLSYARSQQLFKQNMVSQSDLDSQETLMKNAKANYELARLQLSYARITAPFSGYITARFVDPGALVTADNTMLFTLMNLDTVKVLINVLERDSPLIPILQKAVIVADALPDVKFNGIIARYSRALDMTTRTMLVEIDVPNNEQYLKPGMYVRAFLIISEHPDAITLPTVAVLKDTLGTYVYAVENDKARRIAVKTGIEQNNGIEITSGLSGSEDVVVAGQQFLRDGVQVVIQP